jgi:hypothetical protein
VVKALWRSSDNFLQVTLVVKEGWIHYFGSFDRLEEVYPDCAIAEGPIYVIETFIARSTASPPKTWSYEMGGDSQSCQYGGVTLATIFGDEGWLDPIDYTGLSKPPSPVYVRFVVANLRSGESHESPWIKVDASELD